MKDWVKGLGTPEVEEEEPVFEAVEAQTEKELEERYADSVADDLAAALRRSRPGLAGRVGTVGHVRVHVVGPEQKRLGAVFVQPLLGLPGNRRCAAPWV